MTLDQMTAAGYARTEKEVERVARLAMKDYKTALENVRQEIRNLYAKVSRIQPEDMYNAVLVGDRLGKLEKEIVREYNALAARVGAKEVAASKLAITNEYYRNQYTLDFFSSNVGLDLSFTVINPNAVEISVFGSQDVWRRIQKDTVLRAKYQGILPKYGTLKQVLLENRVKDLQRIRRAITQSFIQGESYARTSIKMRDIFNGIANNTLRVFRTEGNRNANAGHYISMLDARDQGLEAQRFIVATLDGRTRPQSASVDGLVENEDGTFSYPGGVVVTIPGNSGVPEWDINDRESVGSRIEGMEPTVRRARNPVTGETEIVTYRSFDTWAKENGLTKNIYGQLISK